MDIADLGLADAGEQGAPTPGATPGLSWLDCFINKPYQAQKRAKRGVSSRVQTLVALSPHQLRRAEELVLRRYAWRGYRVATASQPQSSGISVPRVTLLAQSGDSLLGTLTVRPGAPHGGLLAEASYADEIEELRRQGRRVGELVKLAIEEEADWRAALDALVQSAYVVTRFMHALTDVVIEVNPRHARFYQRVFGFVVGAAERFCARVGAPSVLMRLDLETFGRRIEMVKF